MVWHYKKMQKCITILTKIWLLALRQYIYFVYLNLIANCSFFTNVLGGKNV